MIPKRWIPEKLWIGLIDKFVVVVDGSILTRKET